MAQNNKLALDQIEYIIQIISGPHKGASYKIISPTVSIGRAPTNDICLKLEPKCGDRQAILFIRNENIILKSFNPAFPSISNNQKRAEHLISHLSQVQIGSTELKFEIIVAPKASNSKFLKNSPQNSSLGVSKKPLAPKRLFIYGAIAVLLALVFLSDDEKKIALNSKTLRTEATLSDDVEKLKESLEKEEQRKSKKLSPSFLDAEVSYQKGFRDYRKGRFERALPLFQSCLTFDPSHALCQRYQALSKKKWQEQTQYQLNLGKKYMERSQYKKCANLFKNVANSLPDKTSLQYKEAQKSQLICEEKTRGIEWRN